MRILIVGGGVAGLALAGFIKKYNLGEAVIAEQAPQFGNIGFIIGIWGNGRKVLKELEIERETLGKYGYEVSWNILEDEHGKLLKAFPINIFSKLGPTTIIERSVLQKGLITTIEGSDIRFGTKVTNIKQLENKQVEVDFTDDKKELFDLVVGADGIHSEVREKVFGSGFLKYYGWGVWVYWLPEDFKPINHVFAATDKGRFYSIFPLYEKTATWFMATVPLSTGKQIETRCTKLLDNFSDFKGPIQDVLKRMPAPEKIFYDDLAYVDMPVWHKGRVVLMGDAQHARSPITGMGASMALEDAYVLADELRKNKKNIDGAIENYSKRRTKRIKQYHKITDRYDRWSMARGFKGILRDIFLPLIPASYFLNMIKRFLEEEV